MGVCIHVCACAYVCPLMCLDTHYFSCQRSGNHSTLLLSCFFSSFAFKHEIEQIVHHKHTLMLTGSVLQTKVNLISLSLHNYMQTHTLSCNQYLFGKTPFMAKIEIQLGNTAMMNPHIIWSGVKWKRASLKPYRQNGNVLTCTKSKKEGLIGISLQQGGDTAGHPFVAFVDELLAEVAVDLQGRHAIMSRQGAVDEVRQLRERENSVKENSKAE